MAEVKSNRALEIGNELASVLVKRHFTILPSLRSAICEEFEKIIPVLRGETIEECAKVVETHGYDRRLDEFAERIRALAEDQP